LAINTLFKGKQMHIDYVKPKGFVTLELKNELGEVTERRVSNLIVNAGYAFLAARSVNTSQGVMSHLAVGTGNTAAAAGQTALVTEAARVALASSTIVTTNATNDSVEYVATFGAGVGTGGLREAGIFNDGTTGTMLARTVYDVINKGALDSLTVTWKIVVA
jgi:hypothetical protein